MIYIAIKQMLARKKQTLLTLLGIVLGATAYVVISGIMLGFQNYLLDQLINNDAHVKISVRKNVIKAESFRGILFPNTELIDWKVPPSGRKDSEQIENAAGWIRKLRNDPEVSAVSGQIASNAIFRRGKITQTGRIIGVIPSEQMKVANISSYMISGKFSDIAEGGDRLIMGEGMSELIGARVSETIFVANGKGDLIPFKIAGIFRTGAKQIDETLCYGNLSSIQKFNQTPSVISDIAIKLKDVNSSLKKAHEWAIDSSVKVQSWQEANASIMNVFDMQDLVRNSMTISILIVASFGIFNILNILINQKKKEIAILRSMGFESKDVLLIFLSQGVLLGFLGGILGIILGYFLITRIELIEFGSPLVNGKKGMLVSYDLMIFVKAFLIAFLSTLVASILPARKAGKMSPIDIIREQS